MKRKKYERIFTIVAAIMLLTCYIIGIYFKKKSSLERLKSYYSNSYFFKQYHSNFFSVRNLADNNHSYLCKGEGVGFGGKLTLFLQIDSLGIIEDIIIDKHNETRSYFQKVENKGLINQLKKRHITEFDEINGIDCITGATCSSQAIKDAALSGAEVYKNFVLNEKSERNKGKFTFGIPEIILIILLFMGGIGTFIQFHNRNKYRYFLLLIGLVTIGIIYNQPLILSKINFMLMGDWKLWKNQIYWIILVFGVFLSVFIAGKNPYCHWFCPFCAVQEVLGKLGNAKKLRKRKLHLFFKWFQRILTFAVVCLALIYRNPTKLNYEVYGGIFDLTASVFIFILLIITLLLSLFILKPWCKYLCPVNAIEGYLKTIRKIIFKRKLNSL